MEKRTFGNTGMAATTLGYGAMEFRHVDEAQAGRLLAGVLDAGINFIDTSPDYGPSEDRIGKWIAHRRDDYFLATKCGCNVPLQGGDDAPRHIWTGAQVRHNIEHSLKRLKTDYVDVWQVHSAPPDELAQSDVLETMLRIKEEGKVRHIAVSISGAAAGRGYGQLRPYLDGDWDQFAAIQVWYSALARANENAMSEAANRGKGMIIRGVVRTVEPAINSSSFCRRKRAQPSVRFTATWPVLMLRRTLAPCSWRPNIKSALPLVRIYAGLTACVARPTPGKRANGRSMN
jgi:aryl-alcohol dehydrogenase-like predicted oxidoreductase